MKVAIIKYNAGNIQSVQFALERLGIEAVVTDEAEILQSAGKVIFPGVGHAQSAMEYLKAKNLVQVITSLKQPVLGICLGMQLLCQHSEEGDTPCLGIFDVQVKKFVLPDLKVPHMGWNRLRDLKNSLFSNLTGKDFVYFVHSYYAELSAATIAIADYGFGFSAALQKDNFYATQFHPEKSGEVGEKILNSFLSLKY